MAQESRPGLELRHLEALSTIARRVPSFPLTIASAEPETQSARAFVELLEANLSRGEGARFDR